MSSKRLDPARVALVFAADYVGNPSSAFGQRFKALWCGSVDSTGTPANDILAGGEQSLLFHPVQGWIQRPRGNRVSVVGEFL